MYKYISLVHARKVVSVLESIFGSGGYLEVNVWDILEYYAIERYIEIKSIRVYCVSCIVITTHWILT